MLLKVLSGGNLKQLIVPYKLLVIGSPNYMEPAMCGKTPIILWQTGRVFTLLSSSNKLWRNRKRGYRSLVWNDNL
ncbi:hypothetical protein JTE90_003987 [Oedothorax gibbosus]|uniref:Uncharacterized protein n=1 Tax=Oedothorax gibbosus TaxID=931172 RepID=A0AAV6UCQ9_9ARAC|nr:hypothetical protein JTE90_003987 [Oedothorax gibbosus]